MGSSLPAVSIISPCCRGPGISPPDRSRRHQHRSSGGNAAALSNRHHARTGAGCTQITQPAACGFFNSKEQNAHPKLAAGPRARMVRPPDDSGRPAERGRSGAAVLHRHRPGRRDGRAVVGRRLGRIRRAPDRAKKHGVRQWQRIKSASAWPWPSPRQSRYRLRACASGPISIRPAS